MRIIHHRIEYSFWAYPERQYRLANGHGSATGAFGRAARFQHNYCHVWQQRVGCHQWCANHLDPQSVWGVDMQFKRDKEFGLFAQRHNERVLI
jgi:hypothetical protein